MGVTGYVAKNCLSRDLIDAVEAAMEGRLFVSSGTTYDFANTIEFQNPDRLSRKSPVPVLSVVEQRIRVVHDHAVLFYSDDTVRLAGGAHFIETALRLGHSAVVCASYPLRGDLRRSLEAHGLDVNDFAERKRYTSLDAVEIASAFTVNGVLDRLRFMDVWSGLVATATEEDQPRVALYCELASLFWADGKEDAAVEVEQFFNELVKDTNVNILCGYSLAYVHGEEDVGPIQRICAEHSSIQSK